MFTTLTVINEKGRRRFLSEENEYKGYTFYTTRLFSKKSENKKRLRKFEVRAAMPVLYEDSEIVWQYKFITLVNSVTEHNSYKKIGVYDASGRLPFILDFIAQKCGIISVFTQKADIYASHCDKIYRCTGTPSIILDTKKDIIGSDIIFSADELYIDAVCPVYSYKSPKNPTIDLPLKCPDYCSPFLIGAGLYFYGGYKEFGEIKLKEG